MSQGNEPGDDENPEGAESNEFDFYFQFTKPLVLYLPTPEDRAIAAAWVQKLEAEPESEEEKRLRVDYLKLLLFVLQRGRLSGIFRKQPPAGPLQPFPQGFNITDMGNLMIDQDDIQGCGAGDARSVPYTIEISNDLREFIAAQEVPNFGVQMYYAWSSDDPIHKWNLFDEEKFPQCVLDKIKLLKEIKSDEKAGSQTKGCNAKKNCDIPLVDRYAKTKVKSPQEIEKSQGRSYQTYVGLIGRMGNGFKDMCEDDSEKYCEQEQRKEKCPKKNGSPKKCSAGPNFCSDPGDAPRSDEFDSLITGLGGNASCPHGPQPQACNCTAEETAPVFETMKTAPTSFEESSQFSGRFCSPRPRAEHIAGPSWAASALRMIDARQKQCGGQRLYPNPAARGEEMKQSCPPQRRTQSPAGRNYLPTRNEQNMQQTRQKKMQQCPSQGMQQVMQQGMQQRMQQDSSCKSQNQAPRCTGGQQVCSCPCPRSQQQSMGWPSDQPLAPGRPSSGGSVGGGTCPPFLPARKPRKKWQLPEQPFTIQNTCLEEDECSIVHDTPSCEQKSVIKIGGSFVPESGVEDEGMESSIRSHRSPGTPCAPKQQSPCPARQQSPCPQNQQQSPCPPRQQSPCPPRQQSPCPQNQQQSPCPPKQQSPCPQNQQQQSPCPPRQQSPCPQNQQQQSPCPPRQQSPCPQNQQQSPCPARQQQSPCPPRQQQSPCPQNQQQSPCPARQQQSHCPQNQQQSPCPQNQKQSPCPPRQQSPCPQNQQQSPCPPRQPSAPCPPPGYSAGLQMPATPSPANQGFWRKPDTPDCRVNPYDQQDVETPKYDYGLDSYESTPVCEQISQYSSTASTPHSFAFCVEPGMLQDFSYSQGVNFDMFTGERDPCATPKDPCNKPQQRMATNRPKIQSNYGPNYVPKGSSGRLGNISNRIDNIKQKTDSHREKCDAVRKRLSSERMPCQRIPPRTPQFSRFSPQLRVSQRQAQNQSMGSPHRLGTGPPSCPDSQPRNYQSNGSPGMLDDSFIEQKCTKNVSRMPSKPSNCYSSQARKSPSGFESMMARGYPNNAPQCNGVNFRNPPAYEDPYCPNMDSEDQDECPKEEGDCASASAPESADDCQQESSTSAECLDGGEECESDETDLLSNLYIPPPTWHENMDGTPDWRSNDCNQGNPSEFKKNSNNCTPAQQSFASYRMPAPPCSPSTENKKQRNLSSSDFYNEAEYAACPASPLQPSKDCFEPVNQNYIPPNQHFAKYSNAESGRNGCNKSKEKNHTGTFQMSEEQMQYNQGYNPECSF